LNIEFAQNWYDCFILLGIPFLCGNFLIYLSGLGIIGVSASNHSTFSANTFSCYGRLDGYYADIWSRCKIFHICEMDHIFTVKCPEGHQFDQRYHSCSSSSDVLKCELSEKYYKDAALPMLSPAPHYGYNIATQLSSLELHMLESSFHGSYTNPLIQNHRYSI